MPKIGVITRTKNRPLLLKRAVQSVVQQSFEDWFLVIVNDGGDPAPVREIVSQVSEKHRARIRQIDHPQSLGMEAASNAGLNALETRYAMIHDDDDSLHPDFFRKTLTYLENPPHPSVRGVVTHTERILEQIEGNTVRKVRSYPYNDWLKTISLRRMLAENVFAPIAFVFDRMTCHEVGAFREDLPVLGDWDFNVRFLARYEIGVIPEMLAYYHNRDDEDTGDYASSVSAKAHLHQFYDNLLRNEWLRNDIEAGRVGLSSLANSAPSLWELGWEIKQEIKRNRFSLFPKRKK
jgi:glycosyltransferase involved in cell wall biosynthesis